MDKALLSLNSGSSSIKFGLYALTDSGPSHRAGGKLEGIGTAPRITVKSDDGQVILQKSWDDGGSLTHEELLDDLYDWANSREMQHEIVAVGHRIVHGGSKFRDPIAIDSELIAELEAFCSLAPLHQPHNLAAVREMAKRSPGLFQVACFDTAFHHTMSPVASRMALRRDLADRGFRRYGFHGLSYEYIAHRLTEIDPAMAKGKVIVAHLGNGASLCAMNACRSVDTTMGFTALDGLMMGTRTGSLDPGVVVHLQLQEGMTAHQVESLLYRESGLLGVSGGISSDMRTLHQSKDPHAAEAIELFVWRAARHSGALMTSLEGLDGIVFTAGIGENDPIIRAAICNRLKWLGIEIDEEANAANAPVISTPGSRIVVRVIPTDEERMIALHTCHLYQGRGTA